MSIALVVSAAPTALAGSDEPGTIDDELVQEIGDCGAVETNGTYTAVETNGTYTAVETNGTYTYAGTDCQAEGARGLMAGEALATVSDVCIVVDREEPDAHVDPDCQRSQGQDEVDQLGDLAQERMDICIVVDRNEPDVYVDPDCQRPSG
jgi:hypothetical protein